MGKYNDPEYWKNLANGKRRRGRPTITDPEKSRDYYDFRIKCTKEEKDILDLACEATGHSKSQTVREALYFLCLLAGKLEVAKMENNAMERRICDICKKPIYDDKLHYRVYLFRPKEYVYEPSHPRKQKKKDICASCWYDTLALIDRNLLKEEKNADSDRESSL